MSTRFYVVAILAAMSIAQAGAADEPAAYLVAAADGAPVTTASGACVRTSQWSSAASYRDCDTLPIAKLVPASAEPAQLDSPLARLDSPPARLESPPRADPIRISMNTLFDFNSGVLRADAGPALDALAKQLTDAHYQKVDIVGHADRMGPGKYNQKLSEQRAEAVRDHLVAHGLEDAKVTAIGVGSTEPLTGKECRALKGKPLIYCLQRDRYTEVTVIGTQTSAMR
jgi:OOP family OmpA-OmpF porin